jgi:hypothetical protein
MGKKSKKKNSDSGAGSKTFENPLDAGSDDEVFEDDKISSPEASRPRVGQSSGSKKNYVYFKATGKGLTDGWDGAKVELRVGAKALIVYERDNHDAPIMTHPFDQMKTWALQRKGLTVVQSGKKDVLYLCSAAEDISDSMLEAIAQIKSSGE